MIKIIPAIDVIEGQCVRLTNGNYNDLSLYDSNPVDMAKAYEDHGFGYLHLVDLDGARDGHVKNWKTLQEIAKTTSLFIDFGGGIKSTDDAQAAFDSGAHQINIGSVAVKKPSLFLKWLSQFGAEKVILGADVRDEKVAVNGWQDQTEIDLFEMIADYSGKGIRHLTCTDISKDGKLQGTATSLYERIVRTFPGIKLRASGGVSTLSEIDELDQLGVDSVIIGKAIYENKISLSALQKYVN